MRVGEWSSAAIEMDEKRDQRRLWRPIVEEPRDVEGNEERGRKREIDQ